MQKIDNRTLSKEAQAELRARVIEYWIKNGNMSKAADIFNVPYITIRKWVKKYNDEGHNSLFSDNRGRPVGKEISTVQENRIIKKITDKSPEQLKLKFGLWTRETVAELIFRETGVRRSVWQIGRYLKEWGFTPQKPAYKAKEQNSEAVNQWLKKQYPYIARLAKQQGGSIFWGDETGIHSSDNRGRSYSLKGHTPTILKTGRQFGITMISAVNNRGKLNFMFHKGGVNSRVFIKFMNKLIRMHRRKIFLIVDNLPAHKTNAVKQWVKEHKKYIEVFYLPAYSPELNPDEYLNQDLKINITNKIALSDQNELKKGVEKFMNKRKRNPKQVKKYFHHPKVRYAA